MNLAVIPSPSLWKPLQKLHSLFAIRARDASDTGSATPDQARRDFILEMMQAHPDAFQHEMDVQTMMHFYPARF